jgi:NAD(P)-dependent dehydrogenase (short-subunit alcohol dehydrogenase family)
MIGLEGQNILITGASKGIGKAIASLLIKNGAQVALHYNTDKFGAESIINTEIQSGSKLFQANLEESQQVIALFKDVIKAYKTIGTIVLNAGIYKEHAVEIPLDDWLDIWKTTMKINLDSVGILTKLAIEHFKNNGGGRLIYIGSRAVFRGETDEYLAYAASKGGVTSLARTVARSFGKDNIKAFVIAPGFTKTQMSDSFIAKYGEEKVLNELSLNQLTKPSHIAPLVGLMCSGQMDHATGSTIDINAGSHIR